jgi:hypothetical protein
MTLAASHHLLWGLSAGLRPLHMVSAALSGRVQQHYNQTDLRTFRRELYASVVVLQM